MFKNEGSAPFSWITLYMENKIGERDYLLTYSARTSFEKFTDGMGRRSKSNAPGFLLVGYFGHKTLDEAIDDGQKFVNYNKKTA